MALKGKIVVQQTLAAIALAITQTAFPFSTNANVITQREAGIRAFLMNCGVSEHAGKTESG